MNYAFAGKVFRVGNNVDTDLIYPGRFLELTDPAEIGSHCFAGLDETISSSFPAGGIIVAGSNFGCGSSREHAAIALIHMGAAAVLAESFARIFFRNGINLGLPLIVCPDISQKVQAGQTLKVNLAQGTVLVQETGEFLQAQPFGEQTLEILSAGGIKPLMRARFIHHDKEDG